MKIVHLSSSDSGGAGLAARRLNRALNEAGADSILLCKQKQSYDPKVIQYNVPIWAKIIGKMPFCLYRQNKYRRYIDNKEFGYFYESLSFPEAIYDVSNHPILQSADIINLHWLGSDLNYPHFFSNINKPVVWTLHDMNPFLGIAHFYGDKIHNAQNEKIEERVRKIKTSAITKNQNLTIVSLCNWMDERASQSDAFKNRRHEIIYNSIDISVFKQYDKQAARILLGIPVDANVFMFCCQYLNVLRKGLDILVEAINKIDANATNVFITVGGDFGQAVDKHFLHFGTVRDERLMAMLYSASDAFILPSLEDNLPNTMLESLCCGTPVISFSNGGMKDIIQTGINGMLLDSSDSDSLAVAINDFILNKAQFNNNTISQNSRVLFSPARQANEYLSLYKDLLNNEW